MLFEPAPPRTDRVADIVIPVAVDMAYSYKVPAGIDLQPGDFVEVPLGTRVTQGVVWAVREAGGGNLKPVHARLDIPALPQKLREFVDWLARWTLAPLGMVLRMVAHTPLNATAEPVRLGLRRAGPAPKRLTPARQRALAALPAQQRLTKPELARLAECSASVIDGLIDEGTLEVLALPPEPVALPPDPDFAPADLESGQAKAAHYLVAALGAKKFQTILLEGVTGSGKTEVYFEAIAAALRAGEQILILMPEIALTTQFIGRFAARFGVEPGQWHSEVSPRRKSRLWSGVRDGSVQVIAGARSALFLPFNNLSLIIVDEEHETAYKQEDGVTYNARDMAIVRARLEGALIVLATATPSIETRVNTEQGRYQHVRLTSRYQARAMPDLAAIDMRRAGPAKGYWLAPRLVAEMTQTIARGEQSLLFLNRRGYAPLTLCKSCGFRFQCKDCSAWLVEHRFRRALTCHHCGHVERRPDACPQCEAVDSLTACGPGIERLGEEVAALFPEARTLVLSSDFPGGTERLRQELATIAQGGVDIIIGTQLVAKGHNFPLLTLVGVVDADVGLANGDPRAGERTFQMLQQVTGRAGRGEARGRALLQTFQPEHPVIRALLSGESEAFYQAETVSREAAGLPPFGRLAALIVSGPDANETMAHARALARTAHQLPDGPRWKTAPIGGLPEADELMVLGPAEAPIALLRGRFRFRLLIKAPKQTDLQGFLRKLLESAPKARGSIRVAIDVDPQSFL